MLRFISVLSLLYFYSSGQYVVMTRPGVDSSFFKSLELYSRTGLATVACFLQVGGGLAPVVWVAVYVTLRWSITTLLQHRSFIILLLEMSTLEEVNSHSQSIQYQ
jgi:hypothetical protein